MYVEATENLVIAVEGVANPEDFPPFWTGEVAREMKRNDDGTLAKITLYQDFTDPVVGWIFTQVDGRATVKEVPEPPRPDFGPWAFVKACVDAETKISEKQGDDADFYVLADYLIGLAHIETKIKNAKNKNPLTDGIGPYQLSSEQWAKFIGDPLGSDFDDLDREDPLEQVYGAAFLALRSMEEISKAIGQNDQSHGDTETTGETGPFVPSYIDVLLAHMIGVKGAVDVRIAKMKDKGGDAIDEIVGQHFGNPDDVEKLFNYHASVLKDAETGDRETIDGALMNAEKLLDEAFKTAYKLIEKHAPEDLPKTDGGSPWYTVAESEREAWKNTHGDENSTSGTARVKDYLGAINFSTAKVVPWCGAFAGFCMKSTGSPFAESIVKGPARAANWKTWGNTSIPLGLDDVPKGAVIVLAPDKGSARSGHVGFFSRYFGPNKDQVELLGGNQSDTVRLSKFARSKIATIRWYSPKLSQDKQGSGAALDGSSEGQFDPILNLIGGLESNNNYNAFFGSVSNQSSPNLTGMTINEVLQWQRGRSPSSAAGKYQFIRRTLKGLRDAGLVDGNALFNQATQDALALALMKRRKLGRFLSDAIDEVEFMKHLAREWASLPVPTDMQGHKRLVRKGQSFYAGDGLNKALAAVDVVRSAVRAIIS